MRGTFLKIEAQKLETFACPYCNALLETGVISCRCCSRDLTPVLPLISRISKLEGSIASLESQLNLMRAERISTQLLPAPTGQMSEEAFRAGPRRFWPLLIGFAALLLAYAMVVLWLDLPLSVLRFSSIAIPLAALRILVAGRALAGWMQSPRSSLPSCAYGR